jgi:hypothetical protein
MAYTNITAEQLIKELWRTAVSDNLRYHVIHYGGYHIGMTAQACNPIFQDQKPDYRFAACSSDELGKILEAIGWGAIDDKCPKLGGRFWSGENQSVAEWCVENKKEVAVRYESILKKLGLPK